MSNKWYVTQGGGKVVEAGNGYRFIEAPDWAPQMLGQPMPDEWGVIGPFDAQGNQLPDSDTDMMDEL